MTVVAIGLAGREKALEGPGTIKDDDFWLNVFQDHAKTNSKFCVPVIGGIAGPEGRYEVFGGEAHALNKFKGRSQCEERTISLFPQAFGIGKATTKVAKARTIDGKEE